MSSDSLEKRRHKRVLFSIQERITGSIEKVGEPVGKWCRAVPILNLSKGGIGFILERGMDIPIQTGTQLKLTDMWIEKKSAHHLDLRALSDADITMVVRWVLDNSYLQHLGFGCEFVNLPSKCQDEIRGFINGAFPGRIE